MKVIIMEPKKTGVLSEIPNEIEDLQNAVGGYIEIVKITDGLCAVVDDESQLKGKEHNILGLVGTIIICGIDGAVLCDVPTSAIRIFAPDYLTKH